MQSLIRFYSSYFKLKLVNINFQIIRFYFNLTNIIKVNNWKMKKKIGDTLIFLISVPKPNTHGCSESIQPAVF